MTTTGPAATAADSAFYDATDIHNYPHGQDACFYGDGLYRATAADIESVAPPQHRLITVTGDGRTCSIIDGRPDNQLSPAQVRGFVRERKGASQDAIIYCPRGWVAEYGAVLFDWGQGELANYPGLFWWLATLDGIRRTPAELAADLAANFNTHINPDRIWADQWTQIPAIGEDAKTDVSERFLPWRP
jgi:hypothetical protein